MADNQELQDVMRKADIIEAHNMEFERTMWRNVMHKRYGFDDLDPVKLRCSAALAATYALPRSLGEACNALGLEQKKDNDGS